MVVSSPYCQEAPPLIVEVGDMQHSYCVNHCGIRIGVLLQNTHWEKRHDQNQQLGCNGFKIWSRRYLAENWKFARYVAFLPEETWIRRVLAWHPRPGRLGRTFMTWDSPLQHFARWQHLADSILTAQTTDSWQHYFNEFCTLIFR